MKYIACIGNFDGVHLGHQKLIERCKELSSPKLKVAAITMDPDPATVYGKDPNRKPITTLEQKEDLLYKFGVEEIFIIPFSKDVSLIPKDKFIEFFLNQFDLDTLICGPDFSFGHRGEGKAATLVKSSIKNFKVEVIDDLKLNDEKISSSTIRNYIKQGNMKLVNQLLGYEYRPVVSVKNNELISENLLPEVEKYHIVLDGEELEVIKGKVNHSNISKKQIRFI